MLGRKEVCNNLIGGIKNVYLMDFVKYPVNLIKLNADKTKLLSFPITIIYEVELRTDTDFSQTFNNDEGIYYDQSIAIALKKDSVTTLNEVRTLLKKELRLIAEDRNGNYHVMGLYNGVSLTDYKRSTGGAKGEFNGYNLTFEAQEVYAAPFINSLEDTGFIEVPEGETFWLASDDTILASDDTKLVSELYL